MHGVVRTSWVVTAIALLVQGSEHAGPPDPGAAVPPDAALEIARLERDLAETRAALAELKQFIEDHHELGSAYAEYTHVKAVAEQAAEERREAELREQQRVEAERRALRRHEARRRRQEAGAEADRLERYAKAGFQPIGQDVFLGRVGHYYPDAAHTMFEVEYDPQQGARSLRTGDGQLIDFGSMTISGSVLNASKDTVNIGLALTFFDEAGYQIGAEIIQVIGAAPDVPVPFTATIDMASAGPFAGARAQVLHVGPAATQGPPEVRTSRRAPPDLATLGESLERALRQAIRLAERELAR